MADPLSLRQYNGTGAQTQFAVPFPYLDKSHVFVKVSGVAVTFTWVNNALIQCTTAPAVGTANVLVQRVTPLATQLVNFADGSMLGESDLDTSTLQSVYAQQELDDWKILFSISTDLTDNKMDAKSKVIKNVATAINPNDAVNKTMLDGVSAGAPSGHGIDSHTDAITHTHAGGNLLVGDAAQGNKYDRLTVGTDKDVLEVDVAQNKRMKWISLAAKLFQMLTTKGDLAVSTGATVERHPVGTNKDVLVADSSQTRGLKWQGLVAWWDDVLTGADVLAVLTGTARLTYNSATEIQLGVGQVPLKVGGVWRNRRLTAAVTKSNASLAASTLYFVYLYDNAGVSTLEISTTGHLTDAAYGIEVKSGDATRMFVGWVFTNGSSQFQQDDGYMGVKSYFNRRPRRLTVVSSQTTTSISLVTLGNFTLTYIADGVEALWQGAVGRWQNTTTAATEQSVVFAEDDGNYSAEQSYRNPGVGENGPLGGMFARTPSEGKHTANIRARVVSGTGQFEVQHSIVISY